MSNYSRWIWNSTNTGIANSQSATIPTPASSVSLTLNGNTVQNGTAFSPSYYRQIGITSNTSSLTTFTFTINGTCCGTPVSSTITGGATNTTIYTPVLFDSVTSISVMGTAGTTAPGIIVTWSVGGCTPFFNINEYSDSWCSFNVNITASSINYSILKGFDNVSPANIIANTTTGAITSPSVITVNAASTVSANQDSLMVLARYLVINVLITSTTAAGTFTASVYQPHGRKT